MKRGQGMQKKVCAFCKKEIDGDGGTAKIPKTVSLMLVDEKVDLHNRCLKPYLNRIETMKATRMQTEKLTYAGWVSKSCPAVSEM